MSLKGGKYIIIKTEIGHRWEYKPILFEDWFWHGNFIKDNFKVFSCGFFNVIPDKFDDYGFKVVCGGEATDFKPGSEPRFDAKIIKEFLLGFKIMFE